MTKSPAISAPYCPNQEELASACPNLSNWPDSWRIESLDMVLGEEIVAFLKPFLLDLSRRNLSRRVFARHRANVWVLGGEIIRSVNLAPKLRTRSAEALILEAVSADGGPLIFGRASEQEQESFDATCRGLHRFMTNRRTSEGGDAARRPG
jgi:hypothetical protein